MKAKITKVSFKKEYESKHGTLFGFEVEYDGKSGYYSSKSKDQKKFVAGQEAEFTEEVKTGAKGPYTTIKPIYNQGQSNFGKRLKVEQSKYSGFAMSYAKDLLVAGVINYEQFFVEAECMFEWMVEKDKEMSS